MTPFEAPKKLRSEKLQSSEDDARGASQGFAAVLLAHVSFKSTMVLTAPRHQFRSAPDNGFSPTVPDVGLVPETKLRSDLSMDAKPAQASELTGCLVIDRAHSEKDLIDDNLGCVGK